VRPGNAVNRREFVAGLGGLAAAATPLSRLVSRFPFPVSRIEKIGLQLYTVRGLMAKDFHGTLAEVAKIGYREVEFAGYFGHTPKDVRAALGMHGLSAPSAHMPFERIRSGWDQVLDDARTVGHEYVVVAWIPEEERRTADGWRRVGELFTSAGEKTRAAGMQFAFHNHNYEFTPVEGRIPYDILLESSDRSLVQFEMDLYWITSGKGDPLAYFKQYPGRFPCVHVKDMDAAGKMVDVGTGTIDWKRIFAQSGQAGIRHYFVEHDEPAVPFDSIRASYEYLKRLEF